MFVADSVTRKLLLMVLHLHACCCCCGWLHIVPVNHKRANICQATGTQLLRVLDRQSRLEACVLLYNIKFHWNDPLANFSDWAEKVSAQLSAEGVSVAFKNKWEAEKMARAGYFIFEATFRSGDCLEGGMGLG
jgi:hypothetical protein